MKSRMDMGEALRNTTLVSRPSDMFFLPSTSAAGQETDSSPASRVSRETAESAGAEDTAASPDTAAVSTPAERSSPRSHRVEAGPPSAESDGPTKSTGKNTVERAGKKAENIAPADTVPPSDAAPDHVLRDTDAPVAESAPTLDIPAPSAASAPAGQDSALSAGVSRETDTDGSAGQASDIGTADSTNPDDDPELVDVAGARFAEIRVVDIHPNRKQPRQVFDEEELAELAYSIGELGVLQPIVVRRSREPGESPYELVMGERRWRATQRAGLETIPAIVRETADDALLRDALLENLHRSQLNPLEEAAAYQQLMEEFGATQEELSRRIGRSRPQISNTIRLLRLPPLVQRRVAAGVLSSGHARALLALSDPAEMERLAQRIVAEGLSVRATEEAVALLDGGKRSTKRSPASTSRHQERLDYIADAFSDRLDTAVKIALGARKGRMTIEFASVEDLNRIIEVLDPGIERD
nr:ParB/RepB/Spo0J family partition protein [Kocuria flava]